MCNRVCEESAHFLLPHEPIDVGVALLQERKMGSLSSELQ